VGTLLEKLTNKMCAKTISLLCAGNKTFAKYQAQGRVFKPKNGEHQSEWD